MGRRAIMPVLLLTVGLYATAGRAALFATVTNRPFAQAAWLAGCPMTRAAMADDLCDGVLVGLTEAELRATLGSPAALYRIDGYVEYYYVISLFARDVAVRLYDEDGDRQYVVARAYQL